MAGVLGLGSFRVMWDGEAGERPAVRGIGFVSHFWSGEAGERPAVRELGSFRILAGRKLGLFRIIGSMAGVAGCQGCGNWVRFA